MAEFIKVAKTTDLSPGEGIVVEANGCEVALFNVAGHFYALNNACRHMQGPLGEGYLEEKIVTCPWHGWQYDVTSGENTLDPNIKVECYPVKVEGEDILVGI